MKLNKEEAKKIAEKIDKEGALYIKKYVVPPKDKLTLVLQTHLVMEKLVNEILEAMLVDSNEIEKMYFSKKVQIMGAMGITQNNIDKKLIEFNSLRNKFAHNLDYVIQRNDLNIFFETTSLARSTNIETNLLQIIPWIIYFLMGVREYYLAFPYYMGCSDNKKRLNRDKGFDFESIEKIYESMDLRGFIEATRLSRE